VLLSALATDYGYFFLSSCGDHFQQALLIMRRSKKERAAILRDVTAGKRREISNDLSALCNNKGVGAF